MNLNEIKKIVEEEYCINIKSIEKIKNVYKINGNDGYCLKVVKYNFSHFYFILSSILHLRNKGYLNVLDIIKNKNNKYYVKLDFEVYGYLTKWIDSRKSDYDNLEELKKIAEELSRLHVYSRDFTITKNMNPRIYWFSWINVFKTRKREIIDFANRISQKAKKSEFDNIFLNNLYSELDRANRSIEGLKNSEYINIMKKHMIKREFCHHDFADHNVLIDKNNHINIIDFDYCILDSHLHDLSSLFIRSMKNHRWSIKKGNEILNSYSKNIEITKDELIVMREFIRFPQSFWQIGLQVYWEQQPWKKEIFLDRITKYLEDREEREEFINNFFN
ncbi:CotS family spore coat protein [Eubacterium multiforme]|uniref:CotS family spore coat protein n=1 Tax=Eubacterium multiforme TaxID=83339 RepID=A0ABT9UR66_9FIRM|nr:CotS family spore coat protein [Eubacterium multiforme]MDQ0148847.1 CotS family spore coat protein [Eubacterium multiforme]